MDIALKKLELLEWLIHSTDTGLLSKLDRLRLESGAAKKAAQPVFGRLKGKIKMADDFDAPLDDFKEYM